MRIAISLFLALLPAPLAYSQSHASVLAPGVISTPAHEGPFAFSPDGHTIYFTRFAPGMISPAFLVSHLENGRWSEPVPAAFPEGASAAPFVLSSDGSKLIFTHTRDSKYRSKLWIADRDGEQWKNARPFGDATEKLDGDQTSPSLASDGTLYFTARLSGVGSGWNVHRATPRNGAYTDSQAMTEDRYNRISTSLNETSVAVSPDGKFLVFSSANAPNGLGGSDLYLADLEVPDGWGAWVANLGPLVNTREDESDPRISADGKRLYFCRSGDIYEIELASVLRPPAESAIWERRGDMPVRREWPQAVVANGLVYLYGGITGEFGKPRTWANEMHVFDPAKASWSSLGPGPDGWKQATLVSFENRLFLFRRGGSGLAEYRPESKRWEVKADAAPFTIGEAWPFQTRTVVLGHKAYTMFGAGEVRSFTYFVEYDFDSNKWTPKRSMPYPAPQLAAYGGRIYAFSGGEDATRVSVYDPSKDEWSEGPRTDMPRFESAVVVHDNEIWLIGGHGVRAYDMDGDINPTVVRFDPRRSMWHIGPALPAQRAAAAAASVNGHLFVFGGVSPGTVFKHDLTVLEYAPAKAAARF